MQCSMIHFEQLSSYLISNVVNLTICILYMEQFVIRLFVIYTCILKKSIKIKMPIDMEIHNETSLITRPTINLKFKNLSFNVGNKKILNGLDGELSSGQLTAILGAGGAGKTTLLNILAGRITKGVSGTIEVNGKPRDLRTFRKMSSYIMQEDLLQPSFNVKESLMTAAELKLGKAYPAKENVIQGIVGLLRLEECLDTDVEKLSGGERKRLCVALELVNNPPIVFLDEPTTGLDDVSMKNLVELLKSLTLQGITVVLTIHQPSDSIFQLFDQVYFISAGSCIYNGNTDNIVTFLESVDMPCPTTHSPADYIIELVHLDGKNTELLRKRMETLSSIDEKIPITPIDFYECHNIFEFPNSFLSQFWILICRMFLQQRRNKTALVLQLGHHILSGLCISVLFYGIGNDGKYAALNVKFFYGIIIFQLFTYIVMPILLYPVEVKLMQREYFNRWYSLKAYYFALTVTMLPVLIVNSILISVITYFLTGQPTESERFFYFLSFSILTAITSQGLGYTIGSIFNPKNGALIGSAVCLVCIVLGIHGIGYGEQTTPWIKYLKYSTFSYHGFVGTATVLLNGRDVMDCDEVFCHFADPQLMLRYIGMQDKTFTVEMVFMMFFLLLHRITMYILLRFRVSPNLTYFVSKYLRLSKDN